MTVASEISRITGNIADTYTAASGKGATMPATQDSDNLATCIASIPAGGGSGKYALLDRVTDDSNNEIGTVSGFFTDANDVEYAVVCLDSQYRVATDISSSTVYFWCSYSGAVTNLPLYSSLSASNVWESKMTATQNTQLILDYCTANGYTSDACSYCRSLSFTIDGVNYSGQLLNTIEMLDILKRYSTIESKDTSASSHTSTNFSSNRALGTSNQYNASNYWACNGNGRVLMNDIASAPVAVVCPVLEIPNA